MSAMKAHAEEVCTRYVCKECGAESPTGIGYAACGQTEFPLPAADCPNPHVEYPRETIHEEAERLLSYWEIHGEQPEVVSKWAMTDMLGILRRIVEAEVSA